MVIYEFLWAILSLNSAIIAVCVDCKLQYSQLKEDIHHLSTEFWQKDQLLKSFVSVASSQLKHISYLWPISLAEPNVPPLDVIDACRHWASPPGDYLVLQMRAGCRGTGHHYQQHHSGPRRCTVDTTWWAGGWYGNKALSLGSQLDSKAIPGQICYTGVEKEIQWRRESPFYLLRLYPTAFLILNGCFFPGATVSIILESFTFTFRCFLQSNLQ